MLAVGEAPEPSEIRYEDVHITFRLRASQQSYTFGVAFAFIILSGKEKFNSGNMSSAFNGQTLLPW